MNQLVVLEQLTPLEIFTPEGTDDILARLRNEAKSHVLDISTKEAAEKEIAEAESRARKAEEDRLIALKEAEAARIAAVAQAERDRAAAEEKAKQAAKAAAEKAEREREAAVQAERDRAEAARKAEEVAAAFREADKKHRAKVNNDALNGIVTHCNSETIDVTPEIAKAVVEAIAKGLIPHVKINY